MRCKMSTIGVLCILEVSFVCALQCLLVFQVIEELHGAVTQSNKLYIRLKINTMFAIQTAKQG